MNIRLLRRVEQQILEEPNRLEMGSFVHYDKAGVSVEDGYCRNQDTLKQRIPVCGTTACIAGWAGVLRGYRGVNEALGQHLLGLSSEQARRLFYVSHWPEAWRDGYINAKTVLEKACIAVARIERFISSKGDE